MESSQNITSRLILNAEDIQQRIQRIAYEIYERNFQESQLIVAGIADRGYTLAQRIGDALNTISHFRFAQHSLQLVSIQLEKFTERQCEVLLSCEPALLEGKSIILVDDVLNTGKTLAYSMRPFLENGVSKMEIAVLVNRSHSKFPVVASYTGYELATTLEEHIEVILDGQQDAAYLR